MHLTKKKIAAVVATTAVVALGAGVAVAYWTTTGDGTGSAATGVSSEFDVTSTAATGGPLTPGGPIASVSFTVANPNTGAQDLSSVVVTVANADGTAWVAVPGCSALDYTIGMPAITYGDIAGGTDVDGTVSITMNNLDSDQDACQGVTVPLYFVAS